MQNFNFIGFLFSLMVSILAFLVTSFTAGFLASLAVVVVIGWGLWLYAPLARKKPSQRFQTLQFGAYTFRMEVA